MSQEPMTTPETTGEPTVVLLQKALRMIADLSEGRREWIMSIPARPDLDPDLVIAGALDALKKENDTLTARVREVEKNAAVYVRRALPESGGYVCDDAGIIPPETVRTMRETTYTHEQAMYAVASLVRSHEALRAQLTAATERAAAAASVVAVMEQVAREAYAFWDTAKPNDSKVGKYLAALGGNDNRVDLNNARAALAAGAPTEVQL